LQADFDLMARRREIAAELAAIDRGRREAGEGRRRWASSAAWKSRRGVYRGAEMEE